MDNKVTTKPNRNPRTIMLENTLDPLLVQAVKEDRSVNYIVRKAVTQYLCRENGWKELPPKNKK
jgi:hypothetical protein